MEEYIKTDQYSAFPVQPWYERHEMIKAAQDHGFEVTEALFEDWIKKGLIGQAERSGLGRGRGSVAWWSSEQFTLFIELLRARKQAKYRIGHLCAFPVWRWIYWGDEGGVGLPQVKRVMETWVTCVKGTTAERERKEARKAMDKLSGLGSSGKRALLNELEAIGSFQKEPDPDVLRYLLDAGVGNFSCDVSSGLGDLRAADITMLSTLLPLRLKAFQQYEQISALPDALWEWARTFLLYIQLQGQRAQPHFAQLPRFANRYRRLTIYDVLWGCCYDLLTPLLLVALMLRPDDSIPRLRACLQPLAWQTGEASSQTITTLLPSPIVLPDGDNLLYLRNIVCIWYQGNTFCFDLDLPFL